MSNTIYPSMAIILQIMDEHKHHYNKIIKREYPEFYTFVSDGQTKGFGRQLYDYLYEPKLSCKYCGSSDLAFKEFTTGYRDYCSQKCCSLGTRDQTKEAWLEKYGVDNPNKTSVVRDKIKKTCNELYGGNSPMSDVDVVSRMSASITCTLKEKFPEEINGRTRKQYTAACRYLTDKVYAEYKNIIDPESKRSMTWVLDHIYSISEAFANDVPIDVVCHYSNMQIIHKNENSSKNSRCDMTLEQLYEGYNKGT